MDESLESLLDSLPPKPSRSKLEPYREFIRELRRRGRSYQEITHILRDRCGVTAGVNSVYNFVRVREKAERLTRFRQRGGVRSAETARPTEFPAKAHSQPRPANDDDAWKNIEKLKQRQSAPPAGEKAFVYNEDEPLKLVRGISDAAAGKPKTKPQR
jgi:hypothetical protein